jgi:hypothetical protein
VHSQACYCIILLTCRLWRMYPISMVILILYYNLINFCINYCTHIMYLYLNCSISYGVNLYLDLQNVNKYKFTLCCCVQIWLIPAYKIILLLTNDLMSLKHFSTGAILPKYPYEYNTWKNHSISMYLLFMSGGMYGDMAWFMSQLFMVGRVMLPGDIALLRRFAPHESLSSSV